MLTFFRVGTDTTGTTAALLCWTLIELSQHPEVEKWLLEETDQAVLPRLDELFYGMPFLGIILLRTF